jgi:hypothetical protein
MSRRAARFVLALVLLVGTAHLLGCSDSLKPRFTASNSNPETELTYAPLDNDTTSYRIRLYWNGFDRDGEVVKFCFAIDADTALPLTQWNSTSAKDSTFTFLVDPILEVRGHVFMISAVDNDGLYDHTPAQRFFSAKTRPPTSQITRGPSTYNPIVASTFTFEWSGRDPDGSAIGGPAAVDSFEYLLLQMRVAADPGHPPLPYFDQSAYVSLINLGVGRTLPPPHDDWTWVGIREAGKRFQNVPAGEYVFAERAVDVAGATEKGLKFGTNIRHFTIVPGSPPAVPLGPTLLIFSSALIQSLGASGPNDVPRKAIQILEGESISFSWSASAATYGGIVVGYTYALDDTSRMPSPDLLVTGATLTSAQLPPGNHFLFVKALDDVGLVTNAVIPILVIHPAFKDPGAPRELLYVDDSLSPGGTTIRIGNYPSDAEETGWWMLTMLPNLGVPLTEWDTYFAGLGGDFDGRKPPSLSDLARYSTVIWNVDFNNGIGNPTGLHRALFQGPQSHLAAYLRGGGTLILSGFTIASNVSNPTSTLYAAATRGVCATLEPGLAYDYSFFARNFMGIDGARANLEGLRTLGARDFVAAAPTSAGIASGYDSALVDRGPLGSGAKWITDRGANGDPNTNNSPGLGQVDGWIMAQDFGCQPMALAVFKPEDPTQPIARPILIYHGVNVGINEEGGPSPREGTVVGIQVQSHGLGEGLAPAFDPDRSLGRMVHLSFPLYFLRDQDALRLLQAAFSYVNASPTLP